MNLSTIFFCGTQEREEHMSSCGRGLSNVLRMMRDLRGISDTLFFYIYDDQREIIWTIGDCIRDIKANGMFDFIL